MLHRNQARPEQGRRRSMSKAAAGLATLLAGASASLPAFAAESHSIGLAITNWRTGVYETPSGKEECPDGFQYNNNAQFKAQFPTPEAQQAWMEKYGHPTNRGPAGENIYFFPTVMTDPLPFKVLRSKIAIGMNLDGDLDGKGTATSLPHEKFTSPDGERGVDNQLYRVIGCMTGWRSQGMIQSIVQQFVRTFAETRTIIEITNVDNEVNDPDVNVTIYRGLDPVYADAKGKGIPFLSQRIDYDKGARYIVKLKGKIEGGVLITEPAEIMLPACENPRLPLDRIIHAGRLRLKLTPDGAEGLLGGYVDIDNWYTIFAKSWGAHATADVQGWSGPATYKAMQQYADYRDPKTGKVTGISTAYQVAFTRTFIVHSQEPDKAKPFSVTAR
jgi:hypothetical protein